MDAQTNLKQSLPVNTTHPCLWGTGEAEYSGDISVGKQTCSAAPSDASQSGPSVSDVSGPPRTTSYFRIAGSMKQEDQDIDQLLSRENK